MAKGRNFIIVHIVWRFVKTSERVDTWTFEAKVNELESFINQTRHIYIRTNINKVIFFLTVFNTKLLCCSKKFYNKISIFISRVIILFLT